MKAAALTLLLAATAAWGQDGGVARPTTLFGCDPEPPSALEIVDEATTFKAFLERNAKPEPEVKFIRGDVPHEPPPKEALDYLNGIGMKGHCWEITSDTAFGNRRVLTQRFEVARAFKVPRRSLAAVLRVGFGGAAQVTTGAYTVQGVVASLGLKHFPLTGFSLEYGLRLVPGWSGPQDRESEIQALALGATLTSALGNDPAWLPFSRTGLQLYVDFQTRSGMWVLSPGWALMVGARYGGATSLGDFEVHTWLGPQNAFIGNVSVEAYLGAPLLNDVMTALQVGLHVDVSISSIWPGGQAFPLAWNGFIAWSPLTWLSFRTFIGNGLALGALGKDPPVLMYGLRLQFAAP